MTSSVRWSAALGRLLAALEAGAVWGRLRWGAVWGRWRGGGTIALDLCADVRNEFGGWIEYSALVVYGLAIIGPAEEGRLSDIEIEGGCRATNFEREPETT